MMLVKFVCDECFCAVRAGAAETYVPNPANVPGVAFAVGFEVAEDADPDEVLRGVTVTCPHGHDCDAVDAAQCDLPPNSRLPRGSVQDAAGDVPTTDRRGSDGTRCDLCGSREVFTAGDGKVLCGPCYDRKTGRRP